ncbi:MAG: DNA translocase FtsK 4TM domain-containing protein [Deltaproteobacteria bacterium]|nr:DNA translocase FtsK 4TM domain-containing protein [Deltaproteobacteria bacterium]
MARAAGRTRRSKSAAREGISRRVVYECVGVGLLGLALLLALALASFSPADPVFEAVAVENRAGMVGASAAALLLGTLGLGAAVVVGALAVIGFCLVLGIGVPRLASRFWAGAGLLLVAAASLPPLLESSFGGRVAELPDGALGRFLAAGESLLVGSWGALLLNSALALIGVLSLTGLSTGAALRALGVVLGWFGGVLAALAVQIGEVCTAVARAARRGALELVTGVRRGFRELIVWREQRRRRVRVAAAREPAPQPEKELQPAPVLQERARAARGGDPMIVDHAADRERERTERQEAFRFEERGPYRLPDISIFERPDDGPREYDRDSLIMNSRILEKKLADFGIGGRVITVHPGPVITMYEFEPASGIKVNRIVNLADDLALALRALSVRIIAPLPGKSVVGIEVANPERDTVYIRDVLEDDSFLSSSSKLNIALGKDIFGNPTHADLAKMPHLLVAGATGTGKSVFLNSLLCSVLSRATPDELKLLLVDPKLLELSIYEGIPHLITDVVTNPKRAAAALSGIVHKMEERYQMMAALAVRSVDQFNARVTKELAAGKTHFRLKAKPGEEEGEEVELRRFPYIVVVIDELADLMVVSAREVEEALQRLAQMARAAGIHLVLATQRPSVDVLTGIIKANFPARISFQVSSRTDSRTILDQNGADHLLGQGDMLFLPPGTSKLQRIHGAFVSEEEVSKLVQQLREQGNPQFDETLIRIKEEAEQSRDEAVDEMYDRAIAIVADTRNASISYIQRRLKVGYNRAARMIEQMEADGIVGPQEGTKPREVYVSAIEP